ncbi:hypothetical protein DDQ50_08225 [Amnibacterium flavum]|uniref:Glycosyltransferase RgtA/B/C/D-like domain-containing protein n=2 Tax=Amnibacterium flavum TaxID=2173173 RepID=A0A2V1HMX6_9MICO|nr:hypothetical protein DDQ50_08225 [Amnibacterium flavum]
MIVLVGSQTGSGSRAGGYAGFFDYSAIWDGQWYWRISLLGYPNELPVDASGYVGENEWAFMPLYPAVVRVVTLVTGLGWPPAAFIVSMGFGFGAAIMVYRLLRDRLDHSAALFSVVLFSVSPLSFMLQMAYAESMQLFFLALALHLLLRRRWVPLLPVIAAVALTRPTGLAFALTLGLYWLVRFFTRSREPFPPRDRIWVAVLTAFSGFMGFAWVLIAWLVTGSPAAYTDTELAWRSSWIGHQHLLPFAPWFQAAPFWFGSTIGPIMVVLIVVGFAALLFLPAVRRLGVEIRLWAASYGLYLFAVFFPQSSLLRLLMPMFPLLGAVGVVRSIPLRVGLVVVSLIAQALWLWATWGPTVNWWSIP